MNPLSIDADKLDAAVRDIQVTVASMMDNSVPQIALDAAVKAIILHAIAATPAE